MAEEFTEAKAERIWNALNRDQDGVLTVEEVKNSIKDLFECVDDDDVKEKFVFFGQEEVKDLTKEEFIKGMCKVNAISDLKSMFTAIDADGNKSITKQELKDGLCKTSLTAEQREVVMEELDYDDNSEYSREEFIDVVKFSKRFTSLYSL